jgi:hypothetical protein
VAEYQAARVEILADDQDGPTRRVVVRLLEPERLHPPLAPASLVVEGEGSSIELHRLLDATEGVCNFATRDTRDLPAGRGSVVGLQPWWTLDVLDLVADTSRRWRAATFDDDLFSDFCPLSWDGFNDGDRIWTDGSRCICPSCHSKFIVGDYLGIRG